MLSILLQDILITRNSCSFSEQKILRQDWVCFFAIMGMYTDYSRAPIFVKTQIRKQRIEVKKMFGRQMPKQPADVRSKHPHD